MHGREIRFAACRSPDECDERGDFLPRHYFGRYSDGAPVLWNHMGFDRAAMQERE